MRLNQRHMPFWQSLMVQELKLWSLNSVFLPEDLTVRKWLWLSSCNSVPAWRSHSWSEALSVLIHTPRWRSDPGFDCHAYCWGQMQDSWFSPEANSAADTDRRAERWSAAEQTHEVVQAPVRTVCLTKESMAPRQERQLHNSQHNKPSPSRKLSPCVNVDDKFTNRGLYILYKPRVLIFNKC